MKRIPRIEKNKVIARRPCQALVHGIVKPLIRLANPIGQTRGVLADDLDRAILRAAVDNQILHVRVRLAQHAQDRALQPTLGVISNRDDREYRLMTHIFS